MDCKYFPCLSFAFTLLFVLHMLKTSLLFFLWIVPLIIHSPIPPFDLNNHWQRDKFKMLSSWKGRDKAILPGSYDHLKERGFLWPGTARFRKKPTFSWGLRKRLWESTLLELPELWKEEWSDARSWGLISLLWLTDSVTRSKPTHHHWASCHPPSWDGVVTECSRMLWRLAFT